MPRLVKDTITWSDPKTYIFFQNYTVHYWIDKGLDRKKLIMGLPLYGQSFTLSSTRDNGLGNQTYGGGTAGEFTRARGFLAYYEICDSIINKGWKVVRDPKNRMGPYAFKGTEWVGFDDIETIKHKTEYIREMGLGGAMVWALDLDDFTDRCGCEKHPLLKTVNRGLGRYKSEAPDCTLSSSFKIQEKKSSVEVPVAPYKGCSGKNLKGVVGKCNKFTICNNDEEMEVECPDRLHWNSKIQGRNSTNLKPTDELDFKCKIATIVSETLIIFMLTDHSTASLETQEKFAFVAFWYLTTLIYLLLSETCSNFCYPASSVLRLAQGCRLRQERSCRRRSRSRRRRRREQHDRRRGESERGKRDRVFSDRS